MSLGEGLLQGGLIKFLPFMCQFMPSPISFVKPFNTVTVSKGFKGHISVTHPNPSHLKGRKKLYIHNYRGKNLG